MVQKIRTSIIVASTFINLACIVALFVLNIYSDKNIDYNNEKQYKKEYSFDSAFYFSSVLTLNSLALFFWIFLISSFCAGECECECNCNCCGGRCCESCSCGNGVDCSCNNCNNNGDAGKLAIVCLIFVCLILIIYYTIKCVGKHISRYIALASIAFVHFCIFIVSLMMADKYFYRIFYIMLFSGFSIAVNMLSISLPNLESCKKLRYKERIPSSEVINYNVNPNQISQINNNIVINNNMNNYNNKPNPNNNYSPVFPNNNQMYPLPIVNNEYNVENQNNEKNANNNSNDIKIQFADINNKDMGDAPLPAFEMQVKK